MAQVHTGGVPQDDFMSNLSRLANDCRARLLSASQNLVEETNKLEAILKAVPMDQLATLHDQLAASKREVLQVVEGFYARLEQTLNQQYAGGIKEDEIEGRAQAIFERIAEDQKAINEFSKDLNNKDRCLEAMQVIKEADFDGEQRAIQNEIRDYEELVKQNQTSIFTNWNVLDAINQHLIENVTIQNLDSTIPQVPFSLYQGGGNQNRFGGPSGEPRESEENVVYQHSPMKLGGIVVQKGSKKPNAYKYEVESPEKVVAAKKETPNRTPNKTEVSRVESYSAANNSVYGAERQVSDHRERAETGERPFRNTETRGSEARGTEVRGTESRATEKEYPKQSHIESFARNAPINSQGPVVVTDDWFDSNHDSQLLHFFQDNSKKLHILDLKKAAATGKFKFEERNLEINFKIPIWHRSIITKQGIIYLTGGSGAGLANDKNLNDVYVYDPIDHTLRPKAKMNYARNSHGICLFQDHIYVVGGCIDEEGYTTQCERYQISRYYEKSVGEWDKIAPLNKAAYAPCLASFNDTYLYKFGGIMNLQQMNNTIERYNPKTNKWTEISYSIFGANSENFSLMAYAGCLQINENEVYIFGGSKLDGKSSQTYVCRASEKAHIVQQLELDLPCRGTFWNQSLIFGGKAYTLQTVQLNKSDAFFLSKRRLLCYNGNYWEEVHTDDY